MRSARAFLAPAFLTDASLYLAFAALPFRALQLGAGPVALGALPGLYAVAYMISASNAGHLSDRVPRLMLARAAAVGAAIAAAGLAAASALSWLFVLLPLLGASLGFFWSPLQAALSDRTSARDLGGALGMFNISWTLGKGTGLVLGGAAIAALTPRGVLLVAGLPLLATAALLPRDSRSAGGARRELDDVEEAVSDAVLRLAWLANALAYGLVGTVNMHAPRLLLAQGAGPAYFGALLGAVFGVQTLAFLQLRGRRPGRGWIVASLSCAATAVLLFLITTGPARFLATLPFGAATGIAYHVSLHASLHRPRGRGRAAGLHETLLGAGSTTVPLLGGVAASGTGSLAAPFVVAGAMVLLGLATTLVVRPGTRAASVAAPPDPGSGGS